MERQSSGTYNISHREQDPSFIQEFVQTSGRRAQTENGRFRNKDSFRMKKLQEQTIIEETQQRDPHQKVISN